MENAIKALLMAAGVLGAVMILTLLLGRYNEISDYYTAQQNNKEVKQLADYNKIFDNYNRKKIRGNEMISLMNRVIDYNERQAYDESKKYPRMQVTIILGEGVQANEYWKQFTYKSDSTKNDTIFKDINNQLTNGKSGNKEDDKKLVQITNVKDELTGLLTSKLRSNNNGGHATKIIFQYI